MRAERSTRHPSERRRATAATSARPPRACSPRCRGRAGSPAQADDRRDLQARPRGGELRALGHRGQLGPADGGVDRAEAGPRPEAAVGARDDAVGADDLDEVAQALGDEGGVLDVVGRRVEHAGDEDLVFGDLVGVGAPDRPLVRVAWVGGLELQRRGLQAHDVVEDLLELDVEVVGPLVVAPAQVDADAIAETSRRPWMMASKWPAAGSPKTSSGSSRYMMWRPMARFGAS